MEKKDRKDYIMEVTDEKGNKIEMRILFTTSLEDYDNKNYIFYTNDSDDAKDVFVSSYDEDGKLSPVEDQEEWNKLNEVLEAFIEDQNNKCANCAKEDCDSCENK